MQDDNPYHFIYGSQSLERIREYAAKNGYLMQKSRDESLSVRMGGIELCVINLGMPLQIIRKSDTESFGKFYSGMVKTLDSGNPLTGKRQGKGSHL